jgi:hypothetical protein
VNDYDPKIQEIKPTPSSKLTPLQNEIRGLSALNIPAQRINVQDVQDISQHPLPLCTHCPQQ